MTGTLYINGRFHAQSGITANPPSPAIYAEKGIIRAIGSHDELTLQLSGQHYDTIDWDGSYVLPGLVDSHMHLSMHGMKLSMLDFSDVHSKQDMLHMIRQRVAVTPPGEWIVGLNWNENAFTPAVPPLRTELDEITTEHPIYLTRTCFHAFLANSEAFRRARIDAHTPDPPSGSFGRDLSGELNGWVYEEANQAFVCVQPEPDYATKKDAIRRACQDALRLGLTGAHTEDLRFLGSIDTMLRIHRELHEEGLRFRSHQLIYYTHLDEAESLKLRAGAGNEWLRIGAAKIFSDGAIGGRTALLRQPYADDPSTCGMAIHDQQRLHALTARARRLGFPIAVHAIGDGAAAMTLTAMESYPLSGISHLPDRFIHAQVLDRELVERMTRLPLIADIQPRFVASDFPWVLDRVGAERTDYLYAWNKLMQAGIVCAGGSDAPIEPLDPLLGIHAAVTRRHPQQSEPAAGYLPHERLSIAEAVRLFTEGSAAAVSEQTTRGTIAIGKAADFTVLDRDIYEHEQQLLDARVKMTVVNGEIGYRV
ncbi:amidohydrolase [Paenibacillus campi]|uniref:amidohydrolase n=1 Tax=Paenibacillus campi TaxID=3106031 RepID=UPI002AFEF8DD|nr:amidohydrolase [Paenibacillus sp. SGZ-1014]